MYRTGAGSLTKRIKALTPQFWFVPFFFLHCCALLLWLLFLLDASIHVNSSYLLLSHFSFPFPSHVILCQEHCGPCCSRMTWHLFVFAEDKGLAFVSKAVCPGSTYFLTEESIPYSINNSPEIITKEFKDYQNKQCAVFFQGLSQTVSSVFQDWKKLDIVWLVGKKKKKPSCCFFSRCCIYLSLEQWWDG